MQTATFYIIKLQIKHRFTINIIILIIIIEESMMTQIPNKI